MGKITIITKYDGRSGDIFVAAIACPFLEITDEQRAQLRRDFDCDGAGPTPEDDEDASCLYFRECELSSVDTLKNLKLFNADGEVLTDVESHGFARIVTQLGPDPSCRIETVADDPDGS